MAGRGGDVIDWGRSGDVLGHRRRCLLLTCVIERDFLTAVARALFSVGRLLGREMLQSMAVVHFSQTAAVLAYNGTSVWLGLSYNWNG